MNKQTWHSLGSFSFIYFKFSQIYKVCQGQGQGPALWWWGGRKRKLSNHFILLWNKDPFNTKKLKSPFHSFVLLFCTDLHWLGIFKHKQMKSTLKTELSALERCKNAEISVKFDSHILSFYATLKAAVKKIELRWKIASLYTNPTLGRRLLAN